ncbi:DUF5652 family protein [Nocardia shimofusensis]|uniref:DUF5652 family protein n=1 Tax=Nocardia shimofusensis TaxID=228596 RepID=UPI00082C03CF|nr:DUF5652 family protein [Nocardia shimofusensis]
MAKRKWKDLSVRSRRLIVVTTVLEAILKIAALVDIARRPEAEIRGSKRKWATAVVLVNSVGAVPLAYFLFGRRPSSKG